MAAGSLREGLILGVTGELVRSSAGMRGNMNMAVGLDGSYDSSRPRGRMTVVDVAASFALVVRMAKLTGFLSAVSPWSVTSQA